MHCKEERNDFLKESDSCSHETYDTLDNKRTLTIDYSSGSRWRTSIKVLIPNLIVWLIALFISFPSFFIYNATHECHSKRFSYNAMSILGLSEITMISIQTIVPMLLILATLLELTRKMRKSFDENLVDENLENIFKISIAISSVFLTFQAPKIILSAILMFFKEFGSDFYVNAFCMIFYFGIFIRLIFVRVFIVNKK